MTALAWATIAAAIIAEALMIRVWWGQRALTRPARTEVLPQPISNGSGFDVSFTNCYPYYPTGVGAVWDWETGAPE